MKTRAWLRFLWKQNVYFLITIIYMYSGSVYRGVSKNIKPKPQIAIPTGNTTRSEESWVYYQAPEASPKGGGVLRGLGQVFRCITFNPTLNWPCVAIWAHCRILPFITKNVVSVCFFVVFILFDIDRGVLHQEPTWFLANWHPGQFTTGEYAVRAWAIFPLVRVGIPL